MEINNTEALKNLITEKPALLLYFYNDNCMPCKVLRPKVESLIQNQFPLLYMVFVNASQPTGIAAEYGVYSSPTVLVLFEGKEVIRESKNVSVLELEKKISRYYSLFFEV